MSASWDLFPGDTIRRKDLHARFGGRGQGGIGPSRQSPNVFIFSDPAAGEQHGYVHDGWEGSIFKYTGEGRYGDQQMTQGNRAILDHVKEGRKLRVFDGVSDMVTYVGEFSLDRELSWYLARAPGSGGRPDRNVIVFRLAPIGSFLHEGETHEANKLQPSLATPYVEVSEGPAVGGAEKSMNYDPAKYERGLRAHVRTQNLLAHIAASNGREPLQAGFGDPLYDLGWWNGDIFFLVEVKSVSPLNETSQLRIGLGQVLDYEHYLLDREVQVQAVLALEKAPTDLRWLQLCERHGVLLVWPETFGDLFSGPRQESRNGPR